MRVAVRSLPGGEDAQLADVEAMAALVPAVVLLRDRQRLPQCALIIGNVCLASARLGSAQAGHRLCQVKGTTMGAWCCL